MKRKIIWASLLACFCAAIFVFTAFRKDNTGAGSGYIVIDVGGGGEINVTDGNTLLETIAIKSAVNSKSIKNNDIAIAKCLNDWKAKGFKIISSTGGDYITYYVMEKE